MQNYILAIMAIGGTLLGTLLGAWLNARLARQAEDRRWEREREARLGRERLAAYSHYLALSDRAFNEMIRYSVMYPKGGELASGEFQRLVKQVHQDVFEGSVRVGLLGTDNIGDKARRMHGALLSGLDQLKQGQDDFKDSSAKDSYTRLAVEFIGAVREELGLRHGSMSGSAQTGKTG